MLKNLLPLLLFWLLPACVFAQNAYPSAMPTMTITAADGQESEETEYEGSAPINAVFCAPNKVYEFAGFGIPMLCNDNPGLKYTVEYGGFGVCVPELTTPHIASALKHINANAESMGEAANRYFDSESVEQAVHHTLERFAAIRQEADK